jgi:hypothetical protein
MNDERHLSSDQISAWVMGERTAEAESHVGECPACAAEVEQFGSALAQFRGAVRDWGRLESGAEPGAALAERMAAGRVWFRGWPIRLAAAAAAVLMIVSIPLYRGGNGGGSGKQATAAIAVADSVLLEQVDASVSRTVPGSMEALWALAADDESSTGSANASTGYASGKANSQGRE